MSMSTPPACSTKSTTRSGRTLAVLQLCRAARVRALRPHANPSGSVKGSGIAANHEPVHPVPSGETPATLARARRLHSVS
jgi:hypothetical protein